MNRLKIPPLSLSQQQTALKVDLETNLRSVLNNPNIKSFQQYHGLYRAHYTRFNDALIVLRAQHNCSQLKSLIQKRLIRYGRPIHVNQVIKRLQDRDPITLLAMGKELSKQGLDQSIQLNWLRKHMFPTIQSLPAHGKWSTRFYEGAMHTGIKPKDSGTKSLDAIDGQTFFILKHTSSKGGAQDNTKLEVEQSIREARYYFLSNARTPINVRVYLDGSYWRPELIREMQKVAGNKGQIVVGKCEDVHP